MVLIYFLTCKVEKEDSSFQSTNLSSSTLPLSQHLVVIMTDDHRFEGYKCEALSDVYPEHNCYRH